MPETVVLFTEFQLPQLYYWSSRSDSRESIYSRFLRFIVIHSTELARFFRPLSERCCHLFCMSSLEIPRVFLSRSRTGALRPCNCTGFWVVAQRIKSDRRGDPGIYFFMVKRCGEMWEQFVSRFGQSGRECFPRHDISARKRAAGTFVLRFLLSTCVLQPGS